MSQDNDADVTDKTLPELHRRRDALNGIIDRRRTAIITANSDLYQAEMELRGLLNDIRKIEAVKKSNRK